MVHGPRRGLLHLRPDLVCVGALWVLAQASGHGELGSETPSLPEASGPGVRCTACWLVVGTELGTLLCVAGQLAGKEKVLRRDRDRGRDRMGQGMEEELGMLRMSGEQGWLRGTLEPDVI